MNAGNERGQETEMETGKDSKRNVKPRKHRIIKQLENSFKPMTVLKYQS